MFDTLSEKFDNAFKNLRGKGKISEKNIEDTLKEVKTALLEADVNFKVVKNFVAAVKEQALGEKVIAGVEPGEQFVKIMHDELAKIMGDANEEINLERSGILPILIVGLNGAGKTTFTGKLSHYLKSKKKQDVLVVPADTFRPAAKDQLITLCKQIDMDYFDSDLSMHPGDIAKAAIKHAESLHKKVVLIDTAGRLHIDEELMTQIKQVKSAIEGMNPEVLLVADAMTGQEAVNVAQNFHEAITLTGVVLSKMDSDARGGAALSIRSVTGVSIRYISLGEKMKDLELFHPDRLAKRILDMGDVVSLVEKAQDVIDEKEAERMMKNLEKNKFTIDDFMKQMESISKLGSMGDILKMIPGMGGMLRQIGDLTPAENEMKGMKVIISSMTKKEREDYHIINDSRIQRIAKGSGNTVKSVREFINKFRQMEKMLGPMMKMMKGGGMPGLPGMGGGMPDLGSLMGGGMPQKGFRQGKKGKGKKGKKKGPFGGGYFNI